MFRKCIFLSVIMVMILSLFACDGGAVDGEQEEEEEEEEIEAPPSLLFNPSSQCVAWTYYVLPESYRPNT